MSPSTMTLAPAVGGQDLLDEVVDDLRLLVALHLGERFGGWKRPNSGSSPPLELKWLAITNTVCRGGELAGQRLAAVVQAAFDGSIRPGLSVQLRRRSSAVHDGGRPSSTSPPGRSTKEARASVRKRKPTRMLPPGSPPSWLFTGSIWRNWYAGRRPRRSRRSASGHVSVASAVPLFVAPLLSWISSRARMSGERGWSTISSASASNFAGRRTGRGSRR